MKTARIIADPKDEIRDPDEVIEDQGNDHRKKVVEAQRLKKGIKMDKSIRKGLDLMNKAEITSAPKLKDITFKQSAWQERERDKEEAKQAKRAADKAAFAADLESGNVRPLVGPDEEENIDKSIRKGLELMSKSRFASPGERIDLRHAETSAVAGGNASLSPQEKSRVEGLKASRRRLTGQEYKEGNSPSIEEAKKPIDDYIARRPASAKHFEQVNVEKSYPEMISMDHYGPAIKSFMRKAGIDEDPQIQRMAKETQANIGQYKQNRAQGMSDPSAGIKPPSWNAPNAAQKTGGATPPPPPPQAFKVGPFAEGSKPLNPDDFKRGGEELTDQDLQALEKAVADFLAKAPLH